MLATYLQAQSMDIRVIDAERGSKAAQERNLSGLTLAGAWQLESEEPNFGGLSGLDVLPSGSLLAVSDAGAFVWIGIDPTSGVPDGLGAISYMRTQEGNYFNNKRDADAEGLSFRDGLALVSFEQEHRVSAFNLERCGAGARAADVVQLDGVVDGRKLEPNRGGEGLALVGVQLRMGFEMRHAGGSPIVEVYSNGAVALKEYTSQPALYVLTGLDHANGLTANLFRAYDPVRGPRVILQVFGPDGQLAEAQLKQPLPVDNFEGVAFGTNPQGSPRLWVIADDNFSRDQRTLLLALDLDETP